MSRSAVLPPFSGELRVDKELKLSNDDFKQSIETFYANKKLSDINQLNATPPYPTTHVLAQFANMAYEDYQRAEPKPPDGWQLLTTASNSGMTNGYFGTAYWHPERQQVVITHQGTEITVGTEIKSVGDLVTSLKNVVAIFADVYTDIQGVLFNNYVPQMSSACTFANKVVAVLQEIDQGKKVSFEVFFTGHSLGGWLAQITAFTTQYLKVKGGIFLKKLKTGEHETLASSTVQDSHDVRHSYHPHTVVFESPGCKDMLSQMADKLDVRHKGRSIDLQHLDITIYLSAPNLINTCNSHLGTVYRIFTGFIENKQNTLSYNLATHSMDKIVQLFAPNTEKGKAYKGEPEVLEVVDWPVIAGLTGDAEYNDFFKWAQQLNDYHPQVMDIVPSEVPKGYNPLRYQTKAYDECTMSLSIFTQDEREFLERYRWLRHEPEFFKPEDVFCVMSNAEAEKEAEKILGEFQLDNEIVTCPNASTLHALIPYVKRLVRLFPNIKESIKDKLSSPQIRNRVYQYETQLNVTTIINSAIVFNPDALDLREFLTSDQNIWQLRMTGGDAWRGLTKVYQVLQNTSCTPNYSSDGYYTILKLKRLLTVNRLINFNALLESMATPHLIMIACGNKQPDIDELRDIFEELFNILKQKKTLKIILITQSDDTSAALLQETAEETLGEGLKTTDKELIWSDLTSISQRKLLEKEVIFQGERVALNQLTSAESMRDSFPVADLIQEKELRIGEEPVPSASSGYNEKYYIDRTFNHNIVIRQDLTSDKTQGKFVDILASTEQEFKQLCQQNATRNVHWLMEDKSGELVWQQSQGDLKTLRKYIDPQKPRSYPPGDLHNLLKQAKHQRVMLIADKAGMGKTTVLTHLSKRIKQIFPAHWLVRIDLNNYTELLKAQKVKKMDKEWVLEFISKEVLRLESHLEKELFKKSFERNEINKLVVMVDGFDEISPHYKETVIDMLQILKKTSLEQLWVTTRPHLREELEDNLQQFSYTLQPFSEVEQVEFLKKFWTENLNLLVKNQHRLQIYAKALIRKLAQSISDKDKEFTGIPLQTRMIMEAFEKDFVSFYESEKSEPELPHKLDLLELYTRFIDNKYDIFYKEKSKIQTSTMGAVGIKERDNKFIQLEHQRLALQALFTENELPFLQTDDDDDDSASSDEEFARIGLVQRNNEGKPHFIHRTFAEYFVADFLIKKLTRKTKQPTKKTKQHTQVQNFLLNEVLLKSDHHVMRAFLDALLGKSMPAQEVLEDYGMKLDEQWQDMKVHRTNSGVTTAIHQAAAEDNANIIGFIVDSLKSANSFNTVKEMMFAKNDKGRNACSIAGENRSVQALEKIWEWVEGVAPTTQI